MGNSAFLNIFFASKIIVYLQLHVTIISLQFSAKLITKKFVNE